MEFEQLIKLIETVSASGLTSFQYEEKGVKIKLGREWFSAQFLTGNLLIAQFVAVFRRGTVGIFIKAPVKRGQVVEARLKSNNRDREIPVCGEHGLGCLDALVA